jgi:hypothetical protein
MPLDEQTELFAQRIKHLGRFQFLLRPAIAEGHIGKEVVRLSIRDEDRDTETGEYQFPDASLVQRVRAALAKQSGIPIQRLLAEQENRVPQVLPENRQYASLHHSRVSHHLRLDSIGHSGQRRPHYQQTALRPYQLCQPAAGTRSHKE